MVACTFVVGFPATAHADPSTDPATVVKLVLGSPDPSAALNGLTPAQQAVFATAFANQTPGPFTVSGTGTLAPAGSGTSATLAAAPAAGPSSGAASSASIAGTGSATVSTSSTSGCWYEYIYQEWYDYGFHSGNTWMQLNWCGSGGSITSWSTSNVGGQGLGGVSYDGVVGKGHLNVGWEVRVYREFKFDLYGFVANPCMQIRGGATGLYSYQQSCNLS